MDAKLSVYTWAPSKDENFSLNSAYILSKGLNVLNPPLMLLVGFGNLKLPKNIIIFLWLCSYNNISVRVVLGSRGFTINQSCPLCNNHPESVVHLLRECQSSVSFWNQLGLPLKPSNRLVCLSWIGCILIALVVSHKSILVFPGKLFSFSGYGLSG